MNDNCVFLVLNSKIEHVSPQYHFVFYCRFTTVLHMINDMGTSNWGDLV